jgi:hypothetical protein
MGKENMFMKYTAILLFATLSSLSFTSCGDADNNETAADSTTMEAPAEVSSEVVYYDLGTGKALKKDESSGRYVDESGTPAKFYVDVQSNDTFYGATGQNVNNALIRDNSDWRIDDSKVKITEDKMVIQDDDSKLKVKDEKTKLITDDQKVKVTDKNNDGVKEVKVKNR